MSNADRPEFRALAEVRRVLVHVSEELAAWRRRAQKAEADKNEISSSGDVVATQERMAELERENAELRLRLTTARTRVDDLFQRLKFVEEQSQLEEQRR